MTRKKTGHVKIANSRLPFSTLKCETYNIFGGRRCRRRSTISLNLRYVIFHLAISNQNRFGRCLFLNLFSLYVYTVHECADRDAWVVGMVLVRWRFSSSTHILSIQDLNPMSIRLNYSAIQFSWIFVFHSRRRAPPSFSFSENFPFNFPTSFSLAQLSSIHMSTLNHLIFLFLYFEGEKHRTKPIQQVFQVFPHSWCLNQQNCVSVYELFAVIIIPLSALPSVWGNYRYEVIN